MLECLEESPWSVARFKFNHSSGVWSGHKKGVVIQQYMYINELLLKTIDWSFENN